LDILVQTNREWLLQMVKRGQTATFAVLAHDSGNGPCCFLHSQTEPETMASLKIEDAILVYCGFLVAITMREAAHAIAARALGDRSTVNRITCNPEPCSTHRYPGNNNTPVGIFAHRNAVFVGLGEASDDRHPLLQTNAAGHQSG